MKRFFIIVATALSLCSCSILGGIDWNAEGLASAAGKAATAASISDEMVVELCRQSIVSLDQQNVIDNGAYKQRLARVLSGLTELDGMPLNFAVYKTTDINAFACGDGSIRVYSGLMDIMDDEELTAIIGHELGHVRNKDTKRAIKNAYVASAARDILASAGAYGSMASALLGDIGEALVSAQFSQAQEYKADEHGCQFAIDRGLSPYSMYNALNKLNQLSDGSGGSTIAHMFADHPQTEKRMERMKKMAQKYIDSQE
ncbi:MAG: M48 family metalloprotease [Bacteroidales bacterium]|nr:M48 family metalloprotease [Bacteroidales bacterium]